MERGQREPTGCPRGPTGEAEGPGSGAPTAARAAAAAAAAAVGAAAGRHRHGRSWEGCPGAVVRFVTTGWTTDVDHDRRVRLEQCAAPWVAVPAAWLAPHTSAPSPTHALPPGACCPSPSAYWVRTLQRFTSTCGGRTTRSCLASGRSASSTPPRHGERLAPLLLLLSGAALLLGAPRLPQPPSAPPLQAGAARHVPPPFGAAAPAEHAPHGVPARLELAGCIQCCAARALTGEPTICAGIMLVPAAPCVPCCRLGRSSPGGGGEPYTAGRDPWPAEECTCLCPAGSPRSFGRLLSAADQFSERALCFGIEPACMPPHTSPSLLAPSFSKQRATPQPAAPPAVLYPCMQAPASCT